MIASAKGPCRGALGVQPELCARSLCSTSPDKGQPADKAAASVATTSLAYLLLDLFLAPRADPADDLPWCEDRVAEPPAREKKVKTISQDGAQKRLTLATREGVRLEDCLDAVGRLRHTRVANRGGPAHLQATQRPAWGRQLQHNPLLSQHTVGLEPTGTARSKDAG